jgi:hypothetical protein
MTEVHHEDSHGSPTSTVAHILAIIGSLLLIVVIIWGFVHLLSISGGFFSSLFGGRSSSAIHVMAPESMTSGTLEHISWKYASDAKGSYALIYPCTEGLRFSTQIPDNTFSSIPCGTAYTIDEDSALGTLYPELNIDKARRRDRDDYHLSE